MNNITCPGHTGTPFFEKKTDPKFVAYSRFYGVLNAPSRMWMVRDWAKRVGCRLVGPPQCVFHTEEIDPEDRFCEVQWQMEGGPAQDGGEISFRWIGPATVIAAYHPGRPLAIRDTERALRAWGQDHGYRLTGTCCEVYHRAADAPSEDWTTEIQLFVDGAQDL